MKKINLCSLLLAVVMAFVMPQQSAAKHQPFMSKVTLKGTNRMHKSPMPDVELTGQSFGLLDGPDGLTWHYVQENVSQGYDYIQSVVTVYNAQHELQGSFTVDVPQGMKVNMIEPFGRITTKLFDLLAVSKEVVVYLHEVGSAENNYKGKDHLYVYTIGGNKVAEFEGDGMVVDCSPNEWTQWQRLILSRENADGIHTDIEFYRNPGWGETTATLEKTIQMPTLNLNYTDGAYVHFFNIDGNPRTVICSYEKPFVEYDENGQQVMDYETFMPIFTPNNHFVIDTYDKNYNKISSFKIPSNVPSEQYLVRMNAFGTLSTSDLRKGFFTGDDKLNYIVTNEDVTMTTEYVTSFDVYDQDGNKINTLAENVGDAYKRMADIKGMEEQWLFLSSDGASLFTVDLPSCTRTDLPTSVGNYSISFNMDRTKADTEAGVQYVVGINEATTDATGTNIIAMYAFLDESLKFQRMVHINLGPLAQTFTPLLNEESLDPYLFNTDDQHEFIFLSKMLDGTGSTDGHNTLFIANEEGKILESFNLEPGNPKGDIWTAMIMNYGSAVPSLFVNYYDWDNDNNYMDFHSLPFKSFPAGGDGSVESPYLISSAGDLAQIVKAPGAHYRLAQDFDAHGTAVSVDEFSGVLDGNGKTISNLDVTSNHYYGGLFGTTSDATIKDLTLLNVMATVNSDNQQFGLLSGFAMNTNISNVKVQNGSIDGSESMATPLGTLLGMATAGSKVSDCYITDIEINAKSRTVGGVAGELRTGSTITNTVVRNSDLSAIGELGGITGIVGNGCTVSDCSVQNVTLAANNYLGGVAGRCGVSAARGNIERCVVSAVLNCPSVNSEADVVTNAVGGLTGYIEPDWQKESTAVISGNVLYECRLENSNNNYHLPPFLRIAGATINDEEPTRTETCLVNNYQKPLDLDGATMSEGYDDASSVFGKLLPVEAPALDFWTGLGYAFGTDATAPWVYVEGTRPYLYLEPESGVTGIGSVAADNHPAAGRQGIYTIDGKCLGTITRPGLYIVNGKKVVIK